MLAFAPIFLPKGLLQGGDLSGIPSWQFNGLMVIFLVSLCCLIGSGLSFERFKRFKKVNRAYIVLFGVGLVFSGAGLMCILPDANIHGWLNGLLVFIALPALVVMVLVFLCGMGMNKRYKLKRRVFAIGGLSSVVAIIIGILLLTTRPI